MWDSSSDSESDDTMAIRCAYCGRFCGGRSIDKVSGLCPQCKETLRPELKGEGPTDAEEAEAPDGVGASGRAEAPRSGKAGRNVEGEEAVIGQQRAKAPSPPPPSMPKKRKRADVDSSESNVCARCWVNPATRTLYNSPSCEECYEIAQQKREQCLGTKKRYQPPIHLEPGKKLTRVCDSCRQKRKRCQHRRVVDAEDPAADSRRKRAKTEAASAEASQEEAMQEEKVEEMPAVPGDYSISEDNMQSAIKDSVYNVYKQEMDRLVADAATKVADANLALDAVKQHMSLWLSAVKKPDSNASR